MEKSYVRGGYHFFYGDSVCHIHSINISGKFYYIPFGLGKNKFILCYNGVIVASPLNDFYAHELNGIMARPNVTANGKLTTMMMIFDLSGTSSTPA